MIPPAVCYNVCNGAWNVALRIGKSDSLCEEDGDFLLAYDDCKACVEENDANVRDSIDPKLDEFFIFCGIGLIYTTIPYIRDNGDRATTTLLIGVGDPSTTAIRNTTAATTASSTTSGRSVPTETEGGNLESSDSKDQAWIAGPIVGSIAGLALILALAFWLLKRRRSRHEEQPDEYDGKAQLHGDSLKPPEFVRAELHPDSIHEMQGSAPFEVCSTPSHSEKPANEAVAHEMEGDGGHRQQETHEATPD